MGFAHDKVGFEVRDELQERNLKDDLDTEWVRPVMAITRGQWQTG